MRLNFNSETTQYMIPTVVGHGQDSLSLVSVGDPSPKPKDAMADCATDSFKEAVYFGEDFYCRVLNPIS